MLMVIASNKNEKKKHRETWIKNVINSITLERDQDLLPHKKTTEMKGQEIRTSFLKDRNVIDLDLRSLLKGFDSTNSLSSPIFSLFFFP